MIFSEITLGHYLALSGFLFIIGLAGVLLRRSLLIVMMSLELLLNAANLALKDCQLVAVLVGFLGEGCGHLG